MRLRNCFILLSFTIISISASNVYAQDMVITDHDNRKLMKSDRYFLGPVPIIAFGNGFTNLGLSVEGGYMISDHFSIGGRPIFSYRRERGTDYYTGLHYDEKSTLYGMSLFGRAYITESIFALAEYEWDSFNANVLINNSFYSYDRIMVDGIFIGAGYRQLSNKAYYHILLRYRVTQSDYSAFSNPDIQIGWGFFF